MFKKTQRGGVLERRALFLVLSAVPPSRVFRHVLIPSGRPLCSQTALELLRKRCRNPAAAPRLRL